MNFTIANVNGAFFQSYGSVGESNMTTYGANTVNGSVTVHVCSPNPGQATVTAPTDPSDWALYTQKPDTTVTVTFTQPQNWTLTLAPQTPSIPANGVATDTLTATLKDGNGARVPNATVTFNDTTTPAALGTLTVNNNGNTDTNGQATATFTAGTTTGTATFSARQPNVATPATAQIQLTQPIPLEVIPDSGSLIFPYDSTDSTKNDPVLKYTIQDDAVNGPWTATIKVYNTENLTDITTATPVLTKNNITISATGQQSMQLSAIAGVSQPNIPRGVYTFDVLVTNKPGRQDGLASKLLKIPQINVTVGPTDANGKRTATVTFTINNQDPQKPPAPFVIVYGPKLTPIASASATWTNQQWRADITGDDAGVGDYFFVVRADDPAEPINSTSLRAAQGSSTPSGDPAVSGKKLTEGNPLRVETVEGCHILYDPQNKAFSDPHVKYRIVDPDPLNDGPWTTTVTLYRADTWFNTGKESDQDTTAIVGKKTFTFQIADILQPIDQKCSDITGNITAPKGIYAFQVDVINGKNQKAYRAAKHYHFVRTMAGVVHSKGEVHSTAINVSVRLAQDSCWPKPSPADKFPVTVLVYKPDLSQLKTNTPSIVLQKDTTNTEIGYTHYVGNATLQVGDVLTPGVFICIDGVAPQASRNDLNVTDANLPLIEQSRFVGSGPMAVNFAYTWDPPVLSHLDSVAEQQRAMGEQSDVINYARQPATHEGYMPYTVLGSDGQAIPYPGAPVNQTADTVFKSLPNVAVFSISTHGAPGYLCCKDAAGTGTTTMYTGFASKWNCPKMILAVALACFSSEYTNVDKKTGSVAQAFVNGGAKGAIGFKYESSGGYMADWAGLFWNWTCKGYKSSPTATPQALTTKKAMEIARDDIYAHHPGMDKTELTPEYFGQENVTLFPVRNGP